MNDNAKPFSAYLASLGASLGGTHVWTALCNQEQGCVNCGLTWSGHDPNLLYRPVFGCSPRVPVKDEEDFSMSLIDERQVEVLDDFRAARDAAARHAQSTVDRATLMKINAEAKIAAARELIAELNENTPYPNETGADIGPIPGAGEEPR